MAQSKTTDSLPKLVGLDFEGRYRIEAELGSGGVGVVYRAVDRKLSRPVALKVMREHIVASATLRKRFEREAKALAKLNHPNIVGILDYGVATNMPYLVMELLKGSSLAELLNTSAPLEPERAFNIFRQILQGLSYVHEQGFVHRDLKPGNVFLQPVSESGEHVKLLDFGLAKAVAPENAEGEQVSLTRSGEIFGTPGYIAPEQFSGVGVDERADIYAAGVILFEMLAGHKPFAGQSTELLRNQLVEPIPTLHSICPSRTATPDLETLLHRMLSRDRAARPANIAELRKAIDALSRPPVLIAANGDKQERDIDLAAANGAPDPGVVTRVRKRARIVIPRILQAIRSFIRRIVFAGAFAVAAISVLVIVVAAAIIFVAKRSESTERKNQIATVSAARPSERKTEPKVHVPGTTRRDEPLQATATESPTIARTAPDARVVAPDAQTVANAKTVANPQTEPDSGSGSATKTPEENPAAGKVNEKPLRPPASNPWTKSIPKSLAKVRKFVNAGEYSTERTVASLRRFNKTHPGDSRGYLLLAGLYMNRKWFNDAAKQYDTAYRVDPSCRGDPRMLRDLVKLTTADPTSGYATNLINRIYGREARQAIDRAISGAKQGPSTLDRLHRLRDSLN
jgi:serine/threonine-protein kinase